eukprot:gb/GECG01005410.1/.p1 GENE.gb/GECG01005410.1/~~gb/GECG01005410.1/.p1  ORF type:complete len:537 (+),score=59.92 gb/GECG01005410.1/:1-1611(+)
MLRTLYSSVFPRKSSQSALSAAFWRGIRSSETEYSVSMMPSAIGSHNFSTQLTVESMNANLREAQYAVRGEIVLRAMEHKAALERGESRPFNKVIHCNIGNPQELGQEPLTYPREVLALVNHPALLDNPKVTELFSPDAVQRAKFYVDQIPGGVGAYSNSQGVECVRQEVADFLQGRDGYPATPENVFLTDGASPGVQAMIRAIIRDKSDGVMIPIPQYPLYSASLALYGGEAVGYYLDEESNWGTRAEELYRTYDDAKSNNVNVRAMAVINPGNPTGGCLSKDSMEALVKFCAEKGIILMADEVYQDNIWTEKKDWHSFKQIAAEMGMIDPKNPLDSNKSSLQLVSFHSVSKGFLGECGRRGGYFEMIGFDNEVKQQIYKLASISLCSNIVGQIAVGLMVNPPKEGTAAHKQYFEERDATLRSLNRRSTKLAQALNNMEGITCVAPEGALYVFPTIELPPKAIEAAREEGRPADTFYCLQMLDNTGVVVVPGSGFGQRDGTFHFRTTILPSEDEIDSVIERVSDFHKTFMDKYRS